MPPPSNSPRDEIEWNILRLLLAGSLSGDVHNSLDIAALRGDDFANPEHRAVFEELAHAVNRGFSAQQFQLWLPAAMTRRGLPDLDFNGLFQPPPASPSAREFSELIRQLRAQPPQ